MKYNNNVEGDKNLYHDLESSNSSLRDNDRDKKFFCNLAAEVIGISFPLKINFFIKDSVFSNFEI